MWDLPGPGQKNKGCLISHTVSETLYDPASARGANLHYVYGSYQPGGDIIATTVTIPINTTDDFAPELTGPPALEGKSTPLQNFREGGRIFYRKGFYMELGRPRDDLQLGILVTSLKGPVSMEGRKKSIQILVALSPKEIRDTAWKIAADMDEATGRVVLWGWRCGNNEAKIFIGDLV